MEISVREPDASQNPNQYTGRESDDATGLYFYRARYYDPVLKRFISEDPIGLAGGANVYAYVNGDPVSLSDPTGLVYRKGNGYSDIPPPGPGCQKAVWLGGYIMGWKPCDPPNKPPVCPADGPQPPFEPPENPTPMPPAPPPMPPGPLPMPTPTPPGDPFDYYRCWSLGWSVWAIENLTFGFVNPDGPYSIGGISYGYPNDFGAGVGADLLSEYGNTARKRFAGTWMGRVLTLESTLKYVDNEVCRRVTGYR